MAAESPAAVASVAWDRDGNALLTVRLRDAEHDLTRELSFDRQDPELQRWRSAGLTIATIVDELEVRREEEHAAAAAESADTNGRGEAARLAEKPAAPPPPAAAPAAKPPQTAKLVAAPKRSPARAPFASATHLELGGLGGTGLAGGIWRGGVYAGGAHDLAGLPAFANLTVGYLLSARGNTDLTPSVTWTLWGLGGGFYWVASPFRFELNAELNLVLTSASARATASNAQDTGSRWLPGAALGARGLWPARGPLAIVLGARGDWTAREVVVTNAGARIGRVPAYKVGFLGGMRFSF